MSRCMIKDMVYYNFATVRTVQGVAVQVEDCESYQIAELARNRSC